MNLQACRRESFAGLPGARPDLGHGLGRECVSRKAEAILEDRGSIGRVGTCRAHSLWHIGAETTATPQDEARQVRVTVTDSDVGVSAESAGWLFNTFFTTKSTGLGPLNTRIADALGIRPDRP
jgi:hypothetical protein